MQATHPVCVRVGPRADARVASVPELLWVVPQGTWGQTPLRSPDCTSSGRTPGEGLLGRTVAPSLAFSFWRNLYPVSRSGCVHLHLHQQCTKLLFFSTFLPTPISCLFQNGGEKPN